MGHSYAFTNAIHNGDCNIELRHTREICGLDDPPMRAFWCITHGQWTYEYPVKVTYEFLDGEIMERDSRA